jgi:hypothetical protein
MTTYLPQPDLPTALARSVAKGVAMGVPDGSPWWATLSLPCASGPTVFIVIEDAPRADGSDFTATGLTDEEKEALLPESTLKENGCFPTPP